MGIDASVMSREKSRFDEDDDFEKLAQEMESSQRSIAAAVVAQKIIRDTTLHGCSSHRTTIVQGFGPLTKKLCLLLQIVTVAGRPGLFSKAFFRSKDAIYVTF